MASKHCYPRTSTTRISRRLRLLSLGAYWIAIWAMTVAPIAAVAALRESSVVFAVLIGALFLREPFTRIRVLSVLTVLAGLVMLRL